MRASFWTLTAVTLLGGMAYAQAASSTPDTGAIRDFKTVEEATIRHAKLGFTGNPDVDFRKQLIAKREVIIGMAEVAMAHARSPETEALARKVIANQKRDIAEMERWLRAYPGE